MKHAYFMIRLYAALTIAGCTSSSQQGTRFPVKNEGTMYGTITTGHVNGAEVHYFQGCKRSAQGGLWFANIHTTDPLDKSNAEIWYEFGPEGHLVRGEFGSSKLVEGVEKLIPPEERARSIDACLEREK
jgi:hypothetical protein